MTRMRLGFVFAVFAAFTLALASPAAAQEYGSSCLSNTICISDASVAEGNSGSTTAMFTVTMSPAPSEAVTIAYQTMDNEGTATRGVDYVAASGNVTISPAQPTAQIAITVVGDTAPEPDEAFFVHLASATPSQDISKHHGTGVITNDDGGAGGGGGGGGGTGYDTTAPNTFIHGGPGRVTRARRASFHLASTEPASRFQCKLDARAWRRCGANLTLRRLTVGWHTLRVRAIDAAGNVDRTPARKTWRVRR